MLKKIMGVIRAPFLLLVPACLFPAFAVAYSQCGSLDWSTMALVLIAGLGSHVGVNALNEYEDFRSGLDFTTLRTPFSGGSGTLVQDMAFAPVALYVALGAILLTVTIGLYFLVQVGAEIILPGLLGLALIVGYTRWINHFPLLCLFAPGVGFGLLMMNLSVLVLCGQIGGMSLVASLPVTLLVSNLLLVNQLPDIEPDRRIGRKHLAIVWGPQWAARTSLLLLAGCYLTILVGWLCGFLPMGSMLAWLTAPLVVHIGIKVLKFDPQQINDLIPAMGVNVAVTLVTPILMAVGLLLR